VTDEAASYLTVRPGTPVLDRFGEHVGKLERVLTSWRIAAKPLTRTSSEALDALVPRRA
jgi:hypothetical protein